jgi:chorismate mutase
MIPDARPSELLARVRHEIECVDRSIVLLLAARLDAAQRAIRLRTARNGRVTDPEQERRVLRRSYRWATELGLPRKLVDNLFRSLLEEGKTRFQTGENARELPAVTVLLAAPAGSAGDLGRDAHLQLVPVPSTR